MSDSQEELAYHIGLSLGARASATGLAVVELQGRNYMGENNPVTCQVRWMERFPADTSAPAIIERLEAMVESEPRFSIQRPALVIDSTAAGSAVVDLFTRADLAADIFSVMITGGFEVGELGRNRFTVPKRELVSTVDALLQSGHLKLAPALEYAPVLQRALEGFQIKQAEITAESNSLLWRAESQDDLVFAVALACWKASRPYWRFMWA